MNRNNSVDTVLRLPLTFVARVSYIVPWLLSMPLTGMLFGWHMGRFTVPGYASAIFDSSWRVWYEPALIVAVNLAVFCLLSWIWYQMLRVFMFFYLKAVMGKNSLGLDRATNGPT